MSNAQEDEVRRKAEKPCIPEDHAVKFAKDFFSEASTIVKIKSLESYDDQNFLIENESGTKFTLKFHNGVETDNSPFLEAQNTILSYLHENGVTCPNPISSKNGKMIELIPFKTKDGSHTRSFAMRLLSWVEGSPMSSAKATMDLLYDSGRYFGNLCTILDNFDTKSSENLSTLKAVQRVHQWDLVNLEGISSAISAIQTEEQKSMVKTVIEKFVTKVKPEIPSLKKSILQGDFNDANIILSSEAQSTQIAGVIDFGDMVFSCRVNDVAIAMAYGMLTSCGLEKPVQAAGNFLKGFTSSYELTEKELDLLPILIQSRLAMSVTLGAYSYQQQPENEYLLLHAKPGWQVLEYLLSQDDKDLLEELKSFL